MVDEHVKDVVTNSLSVRGGVEAALKPKVAPCEVRAQVQQIGA
jgi:hypothetical protein